jgi:hypothetical protein
MNVSLVILSKLLVFTIPLFFNGHLVAGKLLDLSVLVDFGASVSFINDCFVERHGLLTKTLESPFRISSFDGSASVSGDVSKFIDGCVFVPLLDGRFLETLVKFHITCLLSADAILGST